MDVVGFGHIDGYVNAWAYRAFRNAAAMLDELPDRKDLAARSHLAATRLRGSYAPALVNPETGWVAGWRKSGVVSLCWGLAFCGGLHLRC